TRRRRSEAVLLRSHRDPFRAQAGIEQPSPARCGINHEVGQSIASSRRGYRAAMEGEGNPSRQAAATLGTVEKSSI
ncbi:MAG: hypothetical protein ACOYES_10100, partial [Bacillota bacterium]